MTPVQASPPATGPSLKRELGRWDLTAIGINQVVGAAVFALPAAVAALVGAWSTLLVVAVGFASLLIALSFAEVSSRFEGTGGPYLYTRAAFGRFASFEVGWMLWITRVASWGAVINVLATSLAYYWPFFATGAPRMLLMAGVIGALAVINVLGIRQSAVFINALTIGKLAALGVFIVIGLLAVDTSRWVPGAAMQLPDLSASALLLVYTFGGYEVVPVPAGESRDPRRAVPFALVTTIVIVTIVFALVQLVCLGTLPGLAASKTPLADAAAIFMGPFGAALMTLGAVLSTLGNNMGQALSGSRGLFALAEQGDLPAVLARIHPRFRTPVPAIFVNAGLALALAVSGTFVTLATVSAVSRLVVYVGTCASTLRLRYQPPQRVVPAVFALPLGPVIPSAAIAIALAILAGATSRQLIAGVAALLCGAVLFVVAVRPWRAAGAETI